MDISTLRIRLDESDLNRLIKLVVPEDSSFEKLAVRLTPEGIHVSGEYPLFVTVKFETVWSLSPQAGQLAAKLVRYKAMGIPGMIFQSTILKMIAEFDATATWVTAQGDTLLIDVERLADMHFLPVRCPLRTVTVTAGQMIVEGGAPFGT